MLAVVARDVQCPGCEMVMVRSKTPAGRFVIECRGDQRCAYFGVKFAAPMIEIEEYYDFDAQPKMKLYDRPLIVFDGDAWEIRRVLSAGSHTFITSDKDVERVPTLAHVVRWFIASGVSLPVAVSPNVLQTTEQTPQVSSGSRRRRR